MHEYYMVNFTSSHLIMISGCADVVTLRCSCADGHRSAAAVLGPAAAARHLQRAVQNRWQQQQQQQQCWQQAAAAAVWVGVHPQQAAAGTDAVQVG
jgi:hypothetical protein